MDTTKYSPAAGIPSEEHNTVQGSCLSFRWRTNGTPLNMESIKYMDILLGNNEYRGVRNSAQISQITDKLWVILLH